MSFVHPSSNKNYLILDIRPSTKTIWANVFGIISIVLSIISLFLAIIVILGLTNAIPALSAIIFVASMSSGITTPILFIPIGFLSACAITTTLGFYLLGYSNSRLISIKNTELT